MIAVTYAAAPYAKFDPWHLGPTYWADQFQLKTWRKLVAAFDESGLSVRFIARRLGWSKRKVKRVLRSPKSLGRGLLLVGRLCWAMGNYPTVSFEKVLR